ncbi:kinase-like protein [Rhizophagus irregularis]|uniref:Kinase-like protein n=1 Tax=Rhizophagus irregularis TaxID=588596 RepID=A0A2N1MG60_9GLOM|nr:kinase-like protein [Rhizophagus irregularis]
MQNTKNTNEWFNWIEKSISGEYYRLYEQKHFSNIQKVGTGGLGKVYRASWKNSQYFALKSFFNLDDVTAKEIVHELKLQRNIQFHNNIIKFYGIANFDPENQNSQSNNYLLVMEYADSGPLKNYLKENFNSLTWNDKYNFASQLACAVSYLHNEGIVHRDLHSGNVLVHQNIIKLSDFGLSKRIESSSNAQSKLFGMIPYVDPKRFSGQIFSLNKKSDIYSVEISQGLREEPIPDTPEDYFDIYTECWNGEPDKRPTINQVVERLKAIMTKTNILLTENYQPELSLHSTSTEGLNFNPTNIDTLSNIDNSLLYGEMSQIIQNFDKMNIREIVPRSLNEKNLNKIVNDTVNYIFKMINEAKLAPRIKNSKNILDYFDNNVNSQEIYYLLVTNQNDLNSIFLLGYFNYAGIETSENNKEAFDLFFNASEQGHILARYFVGLCYQSGYGTVKDEKLSLKYYKQIAYMGYASGLSKMGYFYEHGIGTTVDEQRAVKFYQEAANLENSMAQFHLALMYYNGKGTEVDYVKAFELFYKLANLGDSDAQYNLGLMYEYGKGIDKDINQAIYWYEQSAKQGDQQAQNKLKH